MSIITRRNFIAGLGAAIAAPAIIRTAGLIMPIKVQPIILPNGMWLESLASRKDLEQFWSGVKDVWPEHERGTLYRLHDGAKVSNYMPLSELRVAPRFRPS